MVPDQTAPTAPKDHSNQLEFINVSKVTIHVLQSHDKSQATYAMDW